jgi:hypothetical protein
LIVLLRGKNVKNFYSHRPEETRRGKAKGEMRIIVRNILPIRNHQASAVGANLVFALVSRASIKFAPTEIYA